jgi:short chain dehydrogenase
MRNASCQVSMGSSPVVRRVQQNALRHCIRARSCLQKTGSGGTSVAAPVFDLSGKTALVTGGSRGLGCHYAGVLARAGARVAILARDRAELETAAAELRAPDRQIHCVAADVADANAVTGAVADVEAALGRSTSWSTTPAPSSGRRRSRSRPRTGTPCWRSICAACG